ncbi:MAG: beta-lactamase family protein [Kutzneria sp.]|nr:beta-lactamase family protein [Kutzneria sp.]MBV9846591.1 beta-lactamase family protein [Kutzneria sp.]
MSKLGETGDWVRERLPELLAQHRVPGVAVAFCVGTEVFDTAAGVLSRATGVEATVDSVFQIGSITKVWTATLVMQLADEGKLDLDLPVRTYLPEFRIADETAATRITVRQLMCHTAGFEGDIFTDTGKGDDCVEKYLGVLGDVAQLFEPGAMFSYNNAGYCVLGRVVEVLRGKPYDECLREHLFVPLRLTHVAGDPYEAILHRAAVGHLQPTPDAEPRPVPVWALTRSTAPAGAMLAMSPRDLLVFARMHLSGGIGQEGTVILSETSVDMMRQRQVELPDLGRLGDAWGLGWDIFDTPSGPVIGHDGGALGQTAFLRVVPGCDVAVAVLTNGGNSFPLYTEIVVPVLRELAGVELPALPVPDPRAPRIDASRYIGTYSSSVSDTVISQDTVGRVWREYIPKGILVKADASPTKTELVSWHGEALLPVEPERGLYLPHAFLGDDGHGRALFLHTGRADRRALADR